MGGADLPFQQLAQHLPTPCWISDADGVITWVNDAWLSYTGKGPEALKRDGLASLHDPEILPEVRRRWAIARTQASRWRWSSRCAARTGRCGRF